MAMTPTESAEARLQTAIANFQRAQSSGDVGTVSLGLQQMAHALQALSVGVRATYMKLDEIELLIRRQGGPGGR